MAIRLKGLKDQVLVITGASSGIGLATARMAAEKRVRGLVLASRNISELDYVAAELRSQGVEAIAVECDVTKPDAVKAVADRAVQQFGGFDTWVNNAGVTIYGKLTDVPLEEKRQLFETNFWGVVHGCRAAVPVLRQMGGALINVGSILSERVIPLQGMYCASKHAVKAYTDGLRMELEADGYPVSVTLIKPAAINTPYNDHAVNRMDHHPTHTPPVYAPEVVAAAILECACNPKRDVYVGGSAKLYSLMETFVPRFLDLVMEKFMMEKNQSSPRLDHKPQRESLYSTPRKTGEIRGNYEGRVMESSAYTSASLHPGAALLIAGGLGLAAAAGIGYLRSGSRVRVPDDVVRH